MLASALIIAISLVLLVYWFRYSCALLLKDRVSAEAPAQAGRFAFAGVREQLESAANLDPLHASLRRDYELIMYLVKHASGMELDSIEDRLLVLDYKFMQLRYRLTRTLLPRQARQSLSEMVSVLDVLSSRMTPQDGAYTA
jgi:hypothetical protein